MKNLRKRFHRLPRPPPITIAAKITEVITDTTTDAANNGSINAHNNDIVNPISSDGSQCREIPKSGAVGFSVNNTTKQKPVKTLKKTHSAGTEIVSEPRSPKFRKRAISAEELGFEIVN